MKGGDEMFELSIIVGIVTGLGQIMKNFIPSKFMPIVSLVLGIIAGFFFGEGLVAERIFVGVAIGLAASGLFDIAKIPAKVKK